VPDDTGEVEMLFGHARRVRGGATTLFGVATMRLFASAREAAGTGSDVFDLVDGATVADVIAAAELRYGQAFAAVVETCRIWVNGDSVEPDSVVGPDDEVAVLPPVSGGAQ
jgi:sulfur-carrier protein